MWNAGLDEAQVGIKIPGRNINNLRYADDTTLLAESEEELKSLLMKVKEEWKSWLKTTFRKLRWWHLVPSLHVKWMGKQWKQWQTLFWGLQNHCRWWLQPWNKKMLAPWQKSYDNPDSILKSRDITLPTNVRLVYVMGFPVVLYGCESLTVKKAECRRIEAFELWCWRRLLIVLGLQGDPTSPS